MIGEEDRLSVLGLASFTSGAPVRCRIAKSDGGRVDFECTHTFNPEQIKWFEGASALNVIRTARLGA